MYTEWNVFKKKSEIAQSLLFYLSRTPDVQSMFEGLYLSKKGGNTLIVCWLIKTVLLPI